MRVELHKIMLHNWRGAENLVIEFNGQGETVISGTNGTFKSTVAEGYRWGITGKDSLDRKDYDLKNTVKTHLNRGDHEIIIEMSVDRQRKEIRRVFKEVWQRPRGQEQDVFKGNETLFFINDVPFNAGQFAEVIKGWFSDVQFKILTDPLFFNTPNGEKWKWTHMRDILVGMAGEINPNDVFDAAEIFGERRQSLDEAIKTWGALDKLKKEVAEKKKKANDELRGIPESIESQERTKPELLDWSAIEAYIAETSEFIKGTTEQIFEASKGDEGVEQAKQSKRNEIREIEQDIKNFESVIKDRFRDSNQERRSKIADKEGEIRDVERSITSTERDIENHEKDVTRYESEKTQLLTVYNAKIAETLPEMPSDQTVCPTCKREYDSIQVNGLKMLFTSNWNDNHAQAVEKIKADGSAIKRKIEEAKGALENEKSRLNDLRMSKALATSELESLQESKEWKESALFDELSKSNEYQALNARLQDAKRDLENLEKPSDSDGQREQVLEKLNSEKESYAAELAKYQSQLATKSQYERVVSEIERLKQKQTAAGQVIAELEGIEFAIEGYNKARNEVVAQRVNRMFPEGIEYKLFDELNDGTTIEFCELYVNGMPWGTLNTGGKINAGLACINTFQEHWNLYLPVWIDNRESTVEIPTMLSQVINLVVDPTKEKLTVS